jgi:glycerol-3-phosphate dehydrogenase
MPNETPLPSPRLVRDPAAAAAARYDLVVVGGGIHGLFAAYDAASRGLSVALVERGDFGSGLSANHQRTIHGGLRALESGRVGKTRRQIAERRTWARIAPHFIRPLPFLVGTYRFSKRSRLALRAGFRAYDWLGRARNTGVAPELHLPRTRLESAATTRRLFPGVREAGLTGGAVWYDYQMVHPDRLVWTVAIAAARAGATLVNYAEVTALAKSGARVTGVRVKDRLTGEMFDVDAAVTLVAAGAGVRAILGDVGGPPAPPLVGAMNLLVDRPARDIAVAARGPSGRMLTLVPWRERALVGTFQSDAPVDPGTRWSPADVDAALADANATFPALQADRASVRVVHHGLVPGVVRKGRADLLADPRVVAYRRHGVAGLVGVIGTKFTTARRTAEIAVDEVQREIGRGRSRSVTSSRPLPHADIADVEGRLVETLREIGVSLDADILAHLETWYGTEAPAVVRFAAACQGLGRLSPEHVVLDGEIAYAAAEACAVKLDDAVRRRTALGSAGDPGRAALERAAEIMGATLGWSAERRAAELGEVSSAYGVGTRTGSS